MGRFASGRCMQAVAWAIGAAVVALNAALLWQVL
jgi:hypothetical protein